MIKNSCLNKSKISSGFATIKHETINKLMSLRLSFFLTKKRSSLWICPKILQNNRKAQFSCMWLNLGRKTVYIFYLSPFTGLIKNNCLNKSKFASGFAPFQTLVRKTNFLSISVLVSEIVTFLTKKRSSLWISPKILQNNRKAEFSCMWLNLGRKTVFVNINPLLLVWSKTVV